MTKSEEKKYGSRKKPRLFLTAKAAMDFCRSEDHVLWIELPMYDGKFRVYPGGRKEFYPCRS